MKRDKLFVYGTFLSSEGRNRILSSSKLIGHFKTLPSYTMYHLGGFPAISEGGTSIIIGELWDVGKEIIDIIDVIEGHPLFYRRNKIKVFPIDVSLSDDDTSAYVYILPKDKIENRPIISSGSWRKKEEVMISQ